jgi:hypothetical protein
MEDEGLSREDVVEMVRCSARASYKRANRRYHQYAFMVLNDQVLLACKIDQANASDWGTDEFLVYEPCTCNKNADCVICAGTGEVPVIRQTKPTMESARARKSSPPRD